MKKIIICLVAFLMLPTLCFASNIDELVSSYGNYGIKVNSNDEMNNTLESIIKEKETGTYHILFEDNVLDIDKVKEDFSNKYINNKDYFVFDEYGILYPIDKLPEVYDNEVVIIKEYRSLSNDELDHISLFTSYIVDNVNDDNEYNKIKLVYDYLKENIIISEDNTNIYDVIFNSKGNYDSLSITVQYILERLGIKSYIIKNDKYTYNIVELNNKWYTLDFYDEDGLLKGSKTSKVYSKKDCSGLNITVSYLRYKNNKNKVSTITLEDINANKEYLISTFDVVEDTTSKVVEKPTHIITRPVIINKEEDNSNKEFIKSSMEFLLLSLIIILVILIIYKYTKKV